MKFNIRNFFKGSENKENDDKKQENVRSFIGAANTRLTNWINASLSPISSDLNNGLLKTIEKCRELAKNNSIIRAYLSLCVKNIVGKAGFTLQSQLNGSEDINDAIEWAWYDFGKLSNGYLTTDGRLGHNELDSLILRTLLVDGEVFIRVNRNAKNPYGISFEVLDSMNVDFTKQHDFDYTGKAVVLGVEVDRNYKETAYYITEGSTTCYQYGKIEKLDAKDVIHIFKSEFPHQTRGIPPFNAVLNDIKQLEDYRVAEIMAAKTSAVMAIFYERNANSPTAGDMIDEASGTAGVGTFIQELTPGTATVAPTGYSVKSVMPTHPNYGFGDFNKAVLKQAASSLGVSYNKLCKDYEAASFSSLKEASIDENAYFQEQQQFIIDNWKEVEFKLFVENYVMQSDSIIKPSKVKELLHKHSWICQKRAFVDASKEIIAEKYSAELGVKNPIEIITEQGKDVDEVLKGWQKWNELCKKYGVSFVKDDDVSNEILEPIEEKTTEKIIKTDRK